MPEVGQVGDVRFVSATEKDFSRFKSDSDVVGFASFGVGACDVDSHFRLTNARNAIAPV